MGKQPPLLVGWGQPQWSVLPPPPTTHPACRIHSALRHCFLLCFILLRKKGYSRRVRPQRLLVKRWICQGRRPSRFRRRAVPVPLIRFSSSDHFIISMRFGLAAAAAEAPPSVPPPTSAPAVLFWIAALP